MMRPRTVQLPPLGMFPAGGQKTRLKQQKVQCEGAISETGGGRKSKRIAIIVFLKLAGRDAVVLLLVYLTHLKSIQVHQNDTFLLILRM